MRAGNSMSNAQLFQVSQGWGQRGCEAAKLQFLYFWILPQNSCRDYLRIIISPSSTLSIEQQNCDGMPFSTHCFKHAWLLGQSMLCCWRAHKAISKNCYSKIWKIIIVKKIFQYSKVVRMRKKINVTYSNCTLNRVLPGFHGSKRFPESMDKDTFWHDIDFFHPYLLHWRQRIKIWFSMLLIIILQRSFFWRNTSYFKI